MKIQIHNIEGMNGTHIITGREMSILYNNPHIPNDWVLERATIVDMLYERDIIIYRERDNERRHAHRMFTDKPLSEFEVNNSITIVELWRQRI